MSDQLYKLAFSFIKQEAKSAARLLEELEPAEVAEFLFNVPHPLVAGVLREMMPSVCASMLMHVETATVIIWLNELQNNHVCAILRHLDKSSQHEILNQFPLKRRTACQFLLSYNNDMLGAWVETDVPAFPSDMSAKETIKRLKRKSYKEDRIIYVVDDHRRPVGTLSISVLMRSTNAISLESIFFPGCEVISGAVTLSTALALPVWLSSDVVAVVNRRRELVGVIWYSQIRQLLSAQSLLLGSEKGVGQHPAADLMLAFGDSMSGLLDVVRKAID